LVNVQFREYLKYIEIKTLSSKLLALNSKHFAECSVGETTQINGLPINYCTDSFNHYRNQLFLVSTDIDLQMFITKWDFKKRIE